MSFELPHEMTYTPSEFVYEFNTALDSVFPLVEIHGELINFKVTQNKWVYADIADESAKLRVFGPVFKLQHQIADGMTVKILAQPRLHPLYGLSMNFEAIIPIGEGSIKKSAEELARKLRAEGLFDESKKRSLPRYPMRVGLVTSLESAAYADFTKIMGERWRGVELIAHHSSVQGDNAPTEIIRALNLLNETTPALDVIVMIRGGGSPEDLQAFSSEPVVRAVAHSRTPIIAGIGHEIDVSLSELAADVAASTPSNVAELLFPSVKDEKRALKDSQKLLKQSVVSVISHNSRYMQNAKKELYILASEILKKRENDLNEKKQHLTLLHPERILAQGYVLIESEEGETISSQKKMKRNELYRARFKDGIRIIKAED